MANILSGIKIVRGESTGASYSVDALVGTGGQGEVYRVSGGPQELALKWYFPESATTAQRDALERLTMQAGMDKRFLWPLELAVAPEVKGFGYLMPLRATRFKSLFDLMKRQVEPSFRTLMTIGIELAESYWQLHARGLCYCDISFGNVFIDPVTGEVLICDSDNITIDRHAGNRIIGTPRFMAPEVVLGGPPTSDSDRFSLAVLLFYMLHLSHPLEGRSEHDIHCMDMRAMRRLFGEEPIFIFDPTNATNRPVPGFQDHAETYWKLYPLELRELFIRSFTVGLRDARDGRVRETEWRSALVRARDAVFYCSACASESFFDAANPDVGRCWACGEPLRAPLRLHLGRGGSDDFVALCKDSRLYPHHLASAARRYDFSVPWAEVSRHPRDHARFGLKNLSPNTWSYFREDGHPLPVSPGRSASLAEGARFDFGETVGEIRG